MLATGLGLLAAIPATIFYNKFSSEVNKQAQRLEDQTRLRQLSADNQRLRQLLQLRSQLGNELLAPVISRDPGGWWQQLQAAAIGSSSGSSSCSVSGRRQRRQQLWLQRQQLR